MEYPDLYPVTLTGDRVTLREIEPLHDSAAAFTWASDFEFFRYLPHEPVESEAEEQEFLSRLHAAAMARPRREYHLGIARNDSPELVGTTRLTISAPSHRSADIGYGVKPDQWGTGIATEAASLLVAFGFEQLGLHRVWAVHHPANVASGRVLQKIGMQREGRLRENMLAHGSWRDSIAYAILEQEWRAQRG